MPHLMNCRHLGDGWCLDCVKELHDCRSDLLAACKEAERLLSICVFSESVDIEAVYGIHVAIAKAEAAP